MRRGSNGRRPWASITAPDACWPPRWASSRARCSAALRVLGLVLGAEARVEAASVEAVLAAYDDAGAPRGGYAANIQGDLAISANKRGVRIEPMAAFRARRKRK